MLDHTRTTQDDALRNPGARAARVRSLAGTIALMASVAAADAHADWTQAAFLAASDGAANERLGNLATDGDTLVAGVSLAQVGANAGQGKVHVFVKPPDGWEGPMVEVATLTASDGLSHDHFGATVAIDGDTILVGAPDEDTEGSAAGAAYLFVKPPGGWADMTETAKLTSTNVAATDRFGSSVAVEGTTAVVGASGDVSIYVYEMPGGGWVDATQQTANLRTSDVVQGNLLGSTVAISGSVIAAGAGAKDSGAGAIYIFERAGAVWTNATLHTAKLLASDRLATDNLANGNMAMEGDVVVAGVRTRTVGAFGNRGQAYIWNKPAGGWSGTLNEGATLVAFDGGSGDNFGTDVDIIDGVILVGAAATDGIGAGYRFEEPPAGWTGEISDSDRLDAASPAGVQSLGISVALVSETAFLAANQGDVGANVDQGFALAFVDGPCAIAPREDCATAASGKSRLGLAQREGLPAKSSLKWKWAKGGETLADDLGDPGEDTEYNVCMYDGAGTLLPVLTIPAGGTCDGKPCWKMTGSGDSLGFKYKDKSAASSGVLTFGIKAGAAGKSKIVLKAKGAGLDVPELPLVQTPAPAAIQLVNSAGDACWSATFSAPALSGPGTEKWDDIND